MRYKRYVPLGFLVSAAVGAFIFAYTSTPRAETPSSESPIITEAYTRQFSEDTREYKSLLFRFSLIYPQELKVLEYDDGTSATTITFEDQAGTKGFQIFIVPYAEDHITEAQFKKDVPSGVLQEPIDITIDDVRATMFFSKHAILGDTREVWFIHDGFLFEITAPKELDEWLSLIMKTWKFL